MTVGDAILILGGVVLTAGYVYGLFRGGGLAKARKEAIEAQSARIDSLAGSLKDAEIGRQKCMEELRHIQGQLKELLKDREEVKALAMGERVPAALAFQFERLADSISENISRTAQTNLNGYLKGLKSLESSFLKAIEGLRRA